MRRLPVLPAAASMLLLTPVAFAIHPHRHATAHPLVRRTAARTDHAVHTVEHASYSGMSSERATEIQSALIQRGYLSGDPTGNWDTTSVSAMQKMQSDNGWQTKFVPDSRALIKLGLGASGAGSTSSMASAQQAAAGVTSATVPTGQNF